MQRSTWPANDCNIETLFRFTFKSAALTFPIAKHDVEPYFHAEKEEVEWGRCILHRLVVPLQLPTAAHLRVHILQDLRCHPGPFAFDEEERCEVDQEPRDDNATNHVAKGNRIGYTLVFFTMRFNFELRL